MTSSDDQAQKPDASPRGKFWNVPVQENGVVTGYMDVVEKSAYLALSARVAELAADLEEAGKIIRINNIKAVCDLRDERNALREELAAAKADLSYAKETIGKAFAREHKLQTERLKLKLEKIELADALENNGAAQAIRECVDENEKLQALLEEMALAIAEHVESEPGMYGNECVGLGGAEGLETALAKYEQFKQNKEIK